MSTPGILQFTFNLISLRIHTNSGECVKNYDKIPNFFLYKCYKLWDKSSVLNQIWKDEVIKPDEVEGEPQRLG